MRRYLAAFAMLAAFGCQVDADQDLAVVDGLGPLAQPSMGIYNGSAPDSPEHGAVVALHEVFGGGSVYASPFCSGTLISEDVVVTAGHCVEDWGGGVMGAGDLAVYVGDDPSVDLAAHVYTVAEVSQHPDYNSWSLIGDIALLRLSSPVTEPISPVDALPPAQGFTAADAGSIVNFAGFGTTEFGGFGEKLQVDLELGGLGCGGAPGCFGADPNTQVGYAQPAADGGPCSGDSGGPMFVYRSGTPYLGGVTSYGDARCTQYGVSTRVDAYDTYITDFVGDGGGTPPDPDPDPDLCSGYDTEYVGNLTGSGDYVVEPGGAYYYAASNGLHEGHMEGPAGTDFDLYLYQYRRGAWTVISSAESATSVEDIAKNSRRGNYLWVVSSYDGAGDYTLCTSTP